MTSSFSLMSRLSLQIIHLKIIKIIMKKDIKFKTANGWHPYQIRQSGRTYYCYDRSGWSEKKIGESRSMDDAILLAKTDARKHGEIKEVKM